MKKKMSLDSLKSKKTKPTKESQKPTTKVEKTKGKGVQAKESDSKEFKTKVAKEALPDTGNPLQPCSGEDVKEVIHHVTRRCSQILYDLRV